MASSSAYDERPLLPLGPFHQEPRLVGSMGAWNHDRMLEALAGVELGVYDRRILEWLSNWEPSTIAVIAGWIKRARRDAGDAQPCPGCDRRGIAIRQEANGNLVCQRCGRTTSEAVDVG